MTCKVFNWHSAIKYKTCNIVPDGHGKVGILATVYGDEITEPTIIADCGRSGPW